MLSLEFLDGRKLKWKVGGWTAERLAKNVNEDARLWVGALLQFETSPEYRSDVPEDDEPIQGYPMDECMVSVINRKQTPVEY